MGEAIMEPLENRIARLTPEQQQEVMDFVDFLLLKNNLRQDPASTCPSLIMVNTPPVMVPDLPFLHPVGSASETDPSFMSELPASPTREEHSPFAIHEIAVSGDDVITRDYMDYGKFDGNPSPATDAVRKVRHKIIAREEKEKSRHILEWVD
jgi:hypothetical protein